MVNLLPRIGETLAQKWVEMGPRGLQNFVTLFPGTLPRLAVALFDGDATTLRPDKLPLVQTPGTPAAEYIGALLAATTLATAQPTDPARRTLLHLLLRHAMRWNMPEPQRACSPLRERHRLRRGKWKW